MHKKNIRLGIILGLTVIMLFAGCSQQINQADLQPEKSDTEPAENKGDDGTRVYIAPNGEEIELPPAHEINRVVTTSVPLPSAYRLIEQDLSRFVGIHPGSKNDAESSILSKMAPEILDIPTSFMMGADINVEELLKLKPDVVFYYGGFKNQAETLDNIGITAIDTRPPQRGNALDMLMCWVKMLGEVFENENKITDIVDYGISSMNEIAHKTNQLKDDEKVRSLVIFKISSKKIIVSGTGNQGDSWIKLTGAVNVAESINGTSTANMEQIYDWNPDVIYIFNDAMPEDLFNNTFKGQDWSEVKAIQDGRVYKIPVGIARWFPPSGDTPLMMKWMAKNNYPELFSHYDMPSMIKAYYNKYYEYDISDEEIHGILNPIREKQVTRGQGENY